MLLPVLCGADRCVLNYGYRVGITAQAPAVLGEFSVGKTQYLGLFELVAASENVTAGELPALRSGGDLAGGHGHGPMTLSPPLGAQTAAGQE